MCFSTKLHSKEAKTSLSDTSHISYRKQKSLCLFSHAQWRTMSFFLLHTVVCLRSKEEEEIKFMEGTALILLNKSTFFNLITFQSFITILLLLPLSLLTIYFGGHCFPYYWAHCTHLSFFLFNLVVEKGLTFRKVCISG